MSIEYMDNILAAMLITDVPVTVGSLLYWCLLTDLAGRSVYTLLSWLGGDCI